MLYLYAFVPRIAPVPDVLGIGGEVLTAVPLGAVAAVVAHVDGAVEPTDENVVAHARVIDALAAELDAVLPVRFGRGFSDLDDLEAAAARHAPHLLARLDEVCGCVEIGLHVAAPFEAAEHAGSGSAYMRRRLDELARAEALSADIHAPLAERARAAKREPCGVGASPLLRATYLVPRRDIESFRGAVDVAQRSHADLSFACTGPWPPYSFAGLDREETAA